MNPVRRAAVVCNPASVEDVELLAKQIGARCSAAGAPEPLWFETTKDEPGAAQTRAAIEGGADLVLACGGDGTVAACAGELAGTDVALALVPAGTGNLLARNLGVPLDIDQALDVAFGAHRRRLDVLESGQRRFVVMAGLGFDAALIRDTDEDAKARSGWLAYVGGAMRAIRRSPSVRLTISVDGASPLRRNALGVIVGNVGQLQGGLRVLPDAEPDDGVMDVGVLSPRAWYDWPVLVLRILARRPDAGPQAEILRCRSVRIGSNRPVPVEYDGEYTGEADHMQVQVLAGALLVSARPS